MKTIKVLSIVALTLVSACAGPAISDIATDKVKVESDFDDQKAVMAEVSGAARSTSVCRWHCRGGSFRRVVTPASMSIFRLYGPDQRQRHAAYLAECSRCGRSRSCPIRQCLCWITEVSDTLLAIRIEGIDERVARVETFTVRRLLTPVLFTNTQTKDCQHVEAPHCCARAVVSLLLRIGYEPFDLAARAYSAAQSAHCRAAVRRSAVMSAFIVSHECIARIVFAMRAPVHFELRCPARLGGGSGNHSRCPLTRQVNVLSPPMNVGATRSAYVLGGRGSDRPVSIGPLTALLLKFATGRDVICDATHLCCLWQLVAGCCAVPACRLRWLRPNGYEIRRRIKACRHRRWKVGSACLICSCASRPIILLARRHLPSTGACAPKDGNAHQSECSR